MNDFNNSKKTQNTEIKETKCIEMKNLVGKQQQPQYHFVSNVEDLSCTEM